MGKKSKPKQNKKQPNKQPTTTTTTSSQNQLGQGYDKPTLFTDAPESIQKKIQERAQKVQDSKEARPENYTPSPIQEYYPYAAAKTLKKFLEDLAQKKSSTSSKTVRDYLNTRVSGDNLRFQIFNSQNLKQIPGVPQDSLKILLEALDSIGDSSFHFWDCCNCRQRFLDSDTFIAHAKEFHLPKIDDVSRSFLPDVVVDQDWVEEFFDLGSWKPEVALEVLGEMPDGEFTVIDLASLNLENLDPSYLEPGMEFQLLVKEHTMQVRVVEVASLDADFLKKRDAVLESVKKYQRIYRVIVQKKCLSIHAKGVLMGYTLKHICEERILLLGGSEGMDGSLRFVGVSQLEKIEKFLEKVLEKNYAVESHAEKDSLEIGYPDAESVKVVEEWWEFVFRAENNLVVDLQLLCETLGHESEEPNVDEIVDWLYTFPPRARFKCLAMQDWEKERKTRRDMGEMIVKSIKQEFEYVIYYCKNKSEHLNSCKAFERFHQETQKEERSGVEGLLSEFQNLGKVILGSGAIVDNDLASAFRAVVILMRSLRESNDNDRSVEMSLKREVSRALELMDVEVSWFDVNIMKHIAKLRELKLKLIHACFVDYLPALVPIVQTYLRETLEISEASSEEHESGDGSNLRETDHPLKEDEKESDSGEEPVMQDETSKLCLKEKEGDHGLKSDMEKEARLPSNIDSMDEGSSSATVEGMKAAELQRPVNLRNKLANRDTSQSAPNLLQPKWNSSFIHNSSTIEDFWALYDNVRHPSKFPVGAEFYCFKHGIAPMPEDPVCAYGGKWILSCSRGNADTWWTDTLSALIHEQFDDSNYICGAIVSVEEEQEKISIWTKHGWDEVRQLRIGKQWKWFLGYKDIISFVLQDDDTKSLYQV